jgi:hypothetical protein
MREKDARLAQKLANFSPALCSPTLWTPLALRPLFCASMRVPSPSSCTSCRLSISNVSSCTFSRPV